MVLKNQKQILIFQRMIENLKGLLRNIPAGWREVEVEHVTKVAHLTTILFTIFILLNLNYNDNFYLFYLVCPHQLL